MTVVVNQHYYDIQKELYLEETIVNGLKYIRIRCNLSLNDMSFLLGVTRQALSAWENAKKEIPKQRLTELENHFGLDKKFFGEISDSDIDFLLSQPMFRYNLNGKETYTYKLEQDLPFQEQSMYYWKNRNMTLEDEYTAAKKKKKEVLNRIDDIIQWIPSSYRVDNINLINRNCAIYEMINDLLEKLRNTENPLKVPFLYELKNTWRAMLLAYEVIEESELEYRKNREFCSEDGEWIIQLAKILKQHWNDEALYQLERDKKIKERISKK